MSWISRSGNLAETPKLYQGDDGSYTYARVVVNDWIRNGDDFEDGPAVGYDVLVNGRTAERLVALAELDGNVKVLFSGSYRVKEYRAPDGSRHIKHRVSADEIGVSLIGQDVRVPTKQPVEAEPVGGEPVEG